jgi:hypothetical protein
MSVDRFKERHPVASGALQISEKRIDSAIPRFKWYSRYCDDEKLLGNHKRKRPAKEGILGQRAINLKSHGKDQLPLA